LRIVVPRYGKDVSGGSESLARRLALALTQRDWDVEVYTTTAIDEATWSPGFPAGAARDEGVSVRRFPVRRRRHPASFHQLSRAVMRLPTGLRPESLWIHAQGPVAPGLVRALRSDPGRPTLFIPYLYHPTIYGMAVAPHPRLLIPAAHDEPALQLRAVGRMLEASDGLWFSTEEERELVLRHHPGAARVEHAVGTVAMDVPAAIDTHGFRRRRQLDGDYLLYGGRSTPGKGVAELLAGFAELRRRRPQSRLVVMGESPANGGSTPPGVMRIGRVSDAERWAAIAGSTAVVVPSSMESLSLLALEAWATGRPCIVNGASPVLEGQTRRSGAAIVYRSPREFAAAAEHLLDTPASAAALGARGRDYVTTHYQWDAVVERLQTLIASTAR